MQSTRPSIGSLSDRLTLTLGDGTVAGELELSPDFQARFALECELGRGASGMVVLAQDRVNGRPVAIKILMRLGDHARARFVAEGRLLARLAHPHLVQVYDVGTLGDHPYLVTAYQAGGSLSDFMKRGPVGLDESLRIGMELLAGLSTCHQAQVVHRDIKPDNVLFGEDRSARLADLGIARHFGEVQRLTVTGALVGTPLYMSPEQICGQEAGPPADVYAVGLVLHEMLTGQPAIQATSLLELVDAKQRPVADVRERAPEVPAAVADALSAATALDPANRPADATAFRDRLERAVVAASREQTVALPARVKRRRLSGRSAPVPAPVAAQTSSASSTWRTGALAGAAGVGVALLTAMAVRVSERPAPAPIAPSPSARAEARPPAPIPTPLAAQTALPLVRLPAPGISPREHGRSEPLFPPKASEEPEHPASVAPVAPPRVPATLEGRRAFVRGCIATLAKKPLSERQDMRLQLVKMTLEDPSAKLDMVGLRKELGEAKKHAQVGAGVYVALRLAQLRLGARQPNEPLYHIERELYVDPPRAQAHACIVLDAVARGVPISMHDLELPTSATTATSAPAAGAGSSESDPVALYHRAQAFALADRPGAALPLLERALAIRPTWYEAHLLAAILHDKFDHPDWMKLADEHMGLAWDNGPNEIWPLFLHGGQFSRVMQFTIRDVRAVLDHADGAPLAAGELDRLAAQIQVNPRLLARLCPYAPSGE